MYCINRLPIQRFRLNSLNGQILVEESLIVGYKLGLIRGGEPHIITSYLENPFLQVSLIKTEDRVDVTSTSSTVLMSFSSSYHLGLQVIQ